MTIRGWWAAALLVGGGLVFANRGCLNQEAPDERLAGHLAAVCAIARDHVDAPRPGLRLLGGYLGANAGAMLGDLGSTITTIEHVRDDDDHDARAHLAHDRLAAVLGPCEHDWAAFMDAVDGDPEAAALLDRSAERLMRTLEILVGDRVAARDLRGLPARLGHALDLAK